MVARPVEAPPTLAAQLRWKRSEMMLLELEQTALRLFERGGFAATTVEDIASEAQISVRTFYRYFPAKDDVLQVRVDQRSAAVAAALAERPLDEAPLTSLRLAFVEAMAAEDADLTRRWIAVIVGSPDLVRGVLGGVQLKIQRVVAEFLAGRLGVASDALVPLVLAAAVSGVTQAAFSRWFKEGGDLPATIGEGLAVLEQIGDLVVPTT